MTVRFSAEAIGDLEAIVRYIAARNPTAASKLADRVFDAIAHLEASEFEGPLHRLASGEELRSWPVRPLRIFYKRVPDALLILRVRHQARRPLS